MSEEVKQELVNHYSKSAVEYIDFATKHNVTLHGYEIIGIVMLCLRKPVELLCKKQKLLGDMFTNNVSLSSDVFKAKDTIKELEAELLAARKRIEELEGCVDEQGDAKHREAYRQIFKNLDIDHLFENVDSPTDCDYFCYAKGDGPDPESRLLICSPKKQQECYKYMRGSVRECAPTNLGCVRMCKEGTWFDATEGIVKCLKSQKGPDADTDQKGFDLDYFRDLLKKLMKEVRPYTRPSSVQYEGFPAFKEAVEHVS